jgi:hypothetical protein
MIDELKVTCKFCGKNTLLSVYDPLNDFMVCPDCCKKFGHEPPFTKDELLLIYQYLIDEIHSDGKRKLMYGI